MIQMGVGRPTLQRGMNSRQMGKTQSIRLGNHRTAGSVSNVLRLVSIVAVRLLRTSKVKFPPLQSSLVDEGSRNLM